MTTAAVLATGTELTRGELVNTNATWLAEGLTSRGFDVVEIATVADDKAEIRAALERQSKKARVIVCTGGLGPTTDDLTTAVVAELLGVPLVRDATSFEGLRERLARFGRTVSASNAKQADFPVGARILPNERGTAPGFSVAIGSALACFMPGVPSEMTHMFETYVVPLLEPIERSARHQVRLRCFGLPESEVNDRLAGLEAAYGVVIGYRASMSELEVKVLAGGTSLDEARARAVAAAGEVRARLGTNVYAEGMTSLPAVLVELLAARGETLALAESCTGGLGAELVTRVPGASRVFTGSVVAYSNDVKVALLGVPRALIDAHGAVSDEVARAMAEGSRRALGATYGLAFTGIAGPGGGSDEKPVGLVHMALASAEPTQADRRVFPGTRDEIRRRAVYWGLGLLRRTLLATP
jgi:nicotinamide-nucleotide amidase